MRKIYGYKHEFWVWVYERVGQSGKNFGMPKNGNASKKTYGI